MKDLRTPSSHPSSSRSVLLVGVAALLGYVVLVGYAPTLFPVPPDVSSAATALGYNPSVAFFLAAGWSLLIGVVAYALAGPSHDRRQDFEKLPRADVVDSNLGTVRPRAVILVAAIVSLLYFPPFLARYGPYIEDNILLTVQHRMLGGQRPFVDFEFLYGPLMAYSAHGWTKIFGFSLTSFYTYLAALELLLFSSLTVLVHLFVRDRTMRWLSVAALAFLVFNTLMGPNWSGSRKLLGVAAVVVVCLRPLDMRYAIAAGLLAGLQLAYSHDFGVAALASVTAVYGLLWMHSRDATSVRRASLTLAVGVGAWFACSSALTGPGFESYITEVLYLGRRFSSGEAGFRFSWTVNSLAIFALIGLACAVVGRGLRRGEGRPTERDCLLVGGLAFALVTLKSGLNRSDMWHLDAGILLLVLALLPRGGRRVFRLEGAVNTAATIIVGVVVTTYAFGLLPTGSFYAAGWMGGLRDVVTGVPNTSPARAADRIGTEALLVEPERSHPDTDLLELSRYLAAPQRRDRPVFFYASTYALGTRIGVRKKDFLNDDFLYSDRRGQRARRFLEERPSALVLIHRNVYERLYGLRSESSLPDVERRFTMTTAKRLATWLSTNHYDQIRLEAQLKEKRWRETVGRPSLLPCYRPRAAFGDVMVLAPTTECVTRGFRISGPVSSTSRPAISSAARGDG